MKTLSIVLALCFASSNLTVGMAEAEPTNRTSASSAMRGTISVDVLNLKAGGSVLVALFDEPKAFPSFKGQIAARRVAVSGAAARVVFDRIPQGHYAVAVVHDTNDNGRLDTRLGLIPTEPVGFSNGARIGRFGPPSFDAAAFDLASRQRSIRIAVE